MRRIILAFSLPLLLAACDQSPTAPAANAPATSAPAANAATTAPTTSAEPDRAPLVGTWAADLSWCDGNGEGFPITISEGRFEGRENSCDITQWTDGGDGKFTAALSCAAEGVDATENVAMEPIFGPAGEGVRITYVDRGGDPVTVFRCKGATSPQPAQ